MSFKSTLAAAAVLVATIGAGLATTTEANAGYYGHGYRHYSYVPAYTSCRWVPKYDAYGYFLGNFKVCGYARHWGHRYY